MNLKNWEGWHFHHLVRRAKTFGLESEIIKSLENAGWDLIKKGEISKEVIPNLKKSLKRLASIRNFEKTCENPNCFVCRRVVKEFLTNESLSKPWKLSIELYRWQKEAKRLWWEEGGRSIVKVVTGAGKTIFALSLISDLFNSMAYQDGGLRIIIIVPTTVLLDQWLVEVMDKLHILREDIGIFYSKVKDISERKKILIYVIDSARQYLKEHVQRFFSNDDLFLIADECHRYGSKENAKIFEISYAYTLGLSATPERYGDFGFEEKLVPNLGKLIFAYSYASALKDGIIPPYKLVRLKVKLMLHEELIYEELSQKINNLSRVLTSKYPELKKCDSKQFIKKMGKIFEETNDELITKYTALLNQRKSIIHLSQSKLNAVKWLIREERLHHEKVIIFHERIKIAEKIYVFLKENGFSVETYHSEMPLPERLKNISAFRDNKIRVLVTCKALDEGFDVPSADTGIIVAGTSSVRQWIQRMGRILRKSPGKEYSKIYVVFADVVEKDIFSEDELREFEREALSVEMIHLDLGDFYKKQNRMLS